MRARAPANFQECLACVQIDEPGQDMSWTGVDFYGLMANAEEAESFSRAQHFRSSRPERPTVSKGPSAYTTGSHLLERRKSIRLPLLSTGITGVRFLTRIMATATTHAFSGKQATLV